MSHMAKLRSEHSPVIPFHCHFQQKGGPQRPPVSRAGTFLCRQGHLCLFFTAWEHLHAFFPCIYQSSWSDAAFGAASQSWKDICQSFLESSGALVALEAACPLWGGHLRVLNH